jgi:hypothetical protein
MTNFYLITTFVVLLTSAEASDKSPIRHTTSTRLQGATTSLEGSLVGQRSGGLGRDVRVVDIHRVQSRLRAELTEQAVFAPLQGMWSRPQTQRWVRYTLSIFS